MLPIHSLGVLLLKQLSKYGAWLFISVLSAEINGLMRGVPKDELHQLLTNAAGDVITRCLAIFEDKVARSQEDVGQGLQQLDQVSSIIPEGLMEDWDFTVRSKH